MAGRLEYYWRRIASGIVIMKRGTYHAWLRQEEPVGHTQEVGADRWQQNSIPHPIVRIVPPPVRTLSRGGWSSSSTTSSVTPLRTPAGDHWRESAGAGDR